MNARHILPPLLLLLLTITLLNAVSFTANPSITPDGLRTPTTEDTLICTWTPSGDTIGQNTSWYNGSTLYNYTMNDPNNEVILSAGIAKKGEIWTCNVNLTNGTHSTTRTTNVTIKNALPTPPNATDQTLYEDRTSTILIHSTDPDGDVLTYHMEDGIPTYCTINKNTGTVTCTPHEEDIGIENVTFYVKDGGIDWPNTNVTYTVLEVNDPPQLSLTDQAATEGTPFHYDINVSDEEEHWPITFTLDTALASINITPTSDNTARITFTWPGNSPRNTDAGYWLVRVNITDNGPTADTPYDNPYGTATFYLNITTINHPPNITTNFTDYPPSGTQGAPYVFIVNATDNDTTDTITFSITSNCSLANPWMITTINDSYDNATGRVNITSLTNDHVVCNWVNITAHDGEEYDWRMVRLNITNTNDRPTLYEISNDPMNTGYLMNSNTNMSNLTAIKGILFTYKVNATDPDQITYEGETLTYSDNSTNNITINTSTGVISFFPNETEVGNHTINITVTDDEGLWHSRLLRIEVKNNTPPQLEPIGDFWCAEDFPCVKFIDAIDPDPGEDLFFTSNNTAVFDLVDFNETSWLLSFTPTNNQVGTYAIEVTVQDQYGFNDSESFNFTINNTNDAPFFDQNRDGIVDNVTFPLIVADNLFVQRINVTDEDLDIGMDVLTYNFSYINDSGNLNASTSIINQGDDYFIISFMPTIAHIGDYSINLSVTDNSSETYWQVINFTVYPESAPPTIDYIMPYWNETAGRTIFGAFTNASNYPGHEVGVNTTENTIITFDAIISNDTFQINNTLTYRWYIDGQLNRTVTNADPGVNTSLAIHYGFFSSGNTTIRVTAQDKYYATANWTWNMAVENVNRPPIMYNNNSFPNITVNRSSTFTDFMSHYYLNGTWQQLFYDPDDDLNNDGRRARGLGEDTSLTYSITTGYGCSLASLSFEQDTLTIVPSTEGTCFVMFTATDPYNETVDSNLVRIIITAVEVQVIDNPVSSGGGQSRPRTVPFPFEIPTDSPYPIELITPGSVLTYVDESVEVPLTIKNTWKETIVGVSMNATLSNDSFTPTFKFSTDYFPSLAPNEEYDFTLTIGGYRQDEPFNVIVSAYVTNPEYVDSATIMINAMERRDDGDSIESKVTFARDLLNDNPECQELNELLTKADEERLKGNAAEALRLITTTINGCKYLINEQKPLTESPKNFFTLMTITPRQFPALIVGAAIVLILIVFGIMMIISGSKKVDI